MKLWLPLLCSIAMTGCASQHAIVAPTSTRGASVWVRMERTSCFGTCPEYVVEVAADGVVQYEGRRNVCVLGTARTRLSASAIADLRRTIDNADFAHVTNTCCECPLSDVGETIVTVTMTNEPKTVPIVEMCGNIPEQMKNLRNQIDRIIGTQRWLGTEETRSEECLPNPI